MKLKTTFTGLALLVAGSGALYAAPKNASQLSLETPLSELSADRVAKNLQLPAAVKAAAADDAPEFITSVPASAEKVLFNREWRGYWVLNYLISFIMQGVEDGRVQYLYFDGDDVYYPTPVLSFEAPSYIKGKKTDTGISFPLPQCVYSYIDTDDGERKDFYVDFLYWDMDFLNFYTADTTVEHSLDLTLLPDGSYDFVNTEIVEGEIEEDGEMVVKKFPKRILGIVNRDEEWAGYGDIYNTLSKWTAEPVMNAPEGGRTTIMTLTSGVDERKVNVSFEDSRVWVQNFFTEYPGVWVYGDIDGATVKFPRQYVGIDPDGEYLAHFSGATSEMVWNDFLEQDERVVTPLEYAEFSYDESTYTMEAVTDVMIAGGNDCDLALTYMYKPMLQGQPDTMVPHTPEIEGWWNYNPDSGYGRVIFEIPAISQTGAQLDTENLSWSFEIDGEMYVWDPAKHKKLTEAMTWIPYNFTDGDDLIISGDKRTGYFRKKVEYYLAIRLRYTSPDGTELTSDYALATTDKFNLEDWPSLDPTIGVGEINMGDSVAVEYYDHSGRRLKEAPAKGLYIEVKVAADGSRTASKGVR